MSHLVIIGATFVVSFILTSFLYSFLVNFEAFRKTNFSAIASTVLGCVIPSAVVLGFYWNQFDFVSDVGFWSFFAPLIGLALIFASCFTYKKYAVEISVLAASVIGVVGGNMFIDFIPDAPVWVNKICSILAWFLFSVGVRTVATLQPILQIQGVTVGGGFVLLFLFKAAPFMIAAVAVSMFASMLVAYLNHNSQSFEVELSPIIGYMIGWFGLVTYSEMLLPCYIVLVMYCLVEIAVSLIKRLTWMKQYKNFLGNSFVAQVIRSGLAPIVIIKSVWMLSGIVLVFCIFQANGANNYSIPVFIGVVTLWQFYKMINWKSENKSWKEVNKEAFTEIKDTLNIVVDGIKEVKEKKTKAASRAKASSKSKSTPKTVSKRKPSSKTKKATVEKGNTKKEKNSEAKKGKK